MIAAAALAAVLLAPPRPHRPGGGPTYAEPRAWSLQVAAWLRQGAQLCLSTRSPDALSALAPRFGARAAPAPPVGSPRLRAPVQLLGPRGEVTVSGVQGPEGFRCAVEASSGEAPALERDIAMIAAGLGFVRMPTAPARWPGEAAWRGRGPAAGLELFTAAPLVHGAPYGALLEFVRASR